MPLMFLCKHNRQWAWGAFHTMCFPKNMRRHGNHSSVRFVVKTWHHKIIYIFLIIEITQPFLPMLKKTKNLPKSLILALLLIWFPISLGFFLVLIESLILKMFVQMVYISCYLQECQDLVTRSRGLFSVEMVLTICGFSVDSEHVFCELIHLPLPWAFRCP